MAAFFEFAGAATGSAVAITIGKEIVDPEFLTTGIVLSGVVAIIIWALITTHYGMPISLTHGLVAGLVGAGIRNSQWDAIAVSTYLLDMVAAGEKFYHWENRFLG